MTPKITDLTDEEINVLIAEALGGAPVPGWPTVAEREDGTPYSIPDYCRSLDAMHEAEERFQGDDNAQSVFANHLQNIKRSRWDFDLIHATAKQRASAFLLAVGRAVQ